MEWRDEGIVLSARLHGESSVVLELFTREHGRHAGLVYGGTSGRQRAVIQPGNKLLVQWRARLEEHLGRYQLELEKSLAGMLLDDPLALLGLRSACAICGIVPERQAHPALYDGFVVLLETMQDEHVWPAVYVRWELGLLQELGFGLDLSKCVATGTRDELIYVSPRSGGAVCREAGEPYKERLLKLPSFLIGVQAGETGARDILDGLKLTGHFLERHLFAAHGKALPDARQRLMEKMAASAR